MIDHDYSMHKIYECNTHDTCDVTSHVFKKIKPFDFESNYNVGSVN